VSNRIFTFSVTSQNVGDSVRVDQSESSSNDVRVSRCLHLATQRMSVGYESVLIDRLRMKF